MRRAPTELPVIRTLGGCGGTLLSRLFGALPGVVVLSETNPRSANLFGGHLNPLQQLRKWHPHLLEEVADFDDAEIGFPERFGIMLERLLATAERKGLRLILRDFNYADFISVPFLWPVAADTSLDAALNGRLAPRSICLVRHPADQLVSLRSHAAIRCVLSAEQFVSGAMNFTRTFKDKPLFRYEALIDNPASVFRQMCDAIDIPFAGEALTGFTSVTTVTGNFKRIDHAQISPAATKPEATTTRQELARTRGYQELLDALGYAD